MATKKASSSTKGKQKSIEWRRNDPFLLKKLVEHLQRKLDRFGEIEPRLLVEMPDARLAELIEHIKDRKSQLIKQIVTAEKKAKQQKWGAIPRLYSAKQQWGIPLQFQKYPTGVMVKCNLPSGFVAPGALLDLAYHTKSESTTSNHLSYGTVDSIFETSGVFGFSGIIRDDGSDEFDVAEWGSEVDYYMPPPGCDAVVSVEVSISLVSEFSNAMNDGGSGFQAVAFANTDPDGHWPPCVDIGSIQFVMAAFDSVRTGHHEATQKFTWSFLANAGVSPGVAILFITYLSGEDGIVSSWGHWFADYMSYSYDLSPQVHLT